MGNEGSHLSGLVIEEQAIEITDFWCQYQAKINDSCRYFSLKADGSVSVFKGEAALGPLWAVSTPLEKFSNNLLKYRHPCIVRYISAWQQRSILHLATEYVQPLSQVLKLQTPLQICIGLNNILRALVFLHEQAGMSHNNISISAIYVTGDGQWKLGGLQYLCPFSELTNAYLKQARIHRYDKAIDPNEDSYEITSKVDQYAFAVLVEDVFKGHNDDKVPHLKEFKKYCSNLLQHQDPKQRPTLSEALQHNFYCHEFISIYKFLNFLPLKSEEEKNEFFSNILNSLKQYDEETVAQQLGGHLLSRLTLLDQTARKDVIPYILKPKNERSQNEENVGFFHLSVFKEHVKPRLVQLFGVRDGQIRMLLLTHFSKFVHVFSHEELSQHILPELLVGIKDTDDNLVASTLICLSELVPLLGAHTVVGGKRSKLFTDGRPNSTNVSEKPKEHIISYPSTKLLRDLPCTENIFIENNTDTDNFEKSMTLNERPSPVGGESIENEISIANDTNPKADSDEDWSDWDNSNRQLTFSDTIIYSNTNSNSFNDSECVADTNFNSTDTDLVRNGITTKSTLLQKAAIAAKRNIVDITELDIKNQKIENSKKKTDEFDFFADMVPVIEKPSIVNINKPDQQQDFSSKLDFIPDDTLDDNAGWGDNWDE